MRPSGKRVPPAAGMIHSRSRSPSDELLDRVARHANVVAPEVLRQPRLALQRAQEVARLRQAAPIPAAGTSRAGCRIRGRRRRSPAAAWRATDASSPAATRLARVQAATPRSTSSRTRRASSGGKRGSRNAAATALARTSSPSGAPRVHRADAAAQLAVAAQRHERGADLREIVGVIGPRRAARCRARSADRRAREREQRRRRGQPGSSAAAGPTKANDA